MLVAGPKVAEDDASMRQALERLLGTAGFQPAACPTTEAAPTNGTDAEGTRLVSDLRRPGLSGLGFVAKLRDRDESSPLILITAHGSALFYMISLIRMP
jgi:FixJ family two-component response regulator